ncbi:acetoacyl-CoA synthetase [Thelephora terrestris]|uniref:Acetoacyl-CoA synthetase n=1 Tax=Thelephora terrestris TaxID=56493 RepID=A0A9P6L582_9AGAM|nr:acetoacyl-CoA synthetase [Thelephora terrestris]
MLLFSPDDPCNTSRLFRFLREVNDKHGLRLESYQDLYQWSISDIDLLWSHVWDHTGIIGNKGNHVVDTAATPAQNPCWFSDSAINYAENLLANRCPDTTAIVEVAEPTSQNPKPTPVQISNAQLYSLVADAVSALLQCGLVRGDRIASYTSNRIENVVGFLAAAAIGCVWVSASPDFGPQGVLERFDQVRPKLILSVDAVVYNGKIHPHLPKLSTLLSGLFTKSGQSPRVVVVTSGHGALVDTDAWNTEWSTWDAFIETGRKSKLGRSAQGEIEWKRLPFDWPLWILFSSGTTGVAIVHRAGGMLLQSRKELLICADLTEKDVFFYYTTTGWMMWNFLIGGLGICPIVLYDGSPLKRPAHLWNLVDELGITIFGTSAKYIDELSKVYTPREHNKLTTLRHVYSTGSPLPPVLFDFVYQHIKENVLLASITGGTDICSLFAGVCSALPVFRGEIQCRLLGMAVTTFSAEGKPSVKGESGELVCLKPFPCQPVGFWPLPGYADDASVLAAKKRYHDAYFAEHEGVWYHGDHVLLTESRMGNAGGLVMLGRSDGVLNPGGVRFGSAEIYDVIDTCFSGPNPPPKGHNVQRVVDSLVVGQMTEDNTDERVVLFVKLGEDEKLTPETAHAIKREIRVRRSARHVPCSIMQVGDIPYTLNGKRVEVPVKKILNGASLGSFNLGTLRNPEALEEYIGLRETLREELRRV